MRVDIGNALASVATPGVPREALDRLDDDVRRAHERIAEGRASGAFGYAALNLPERTDPGAIRSVAEEFPDAKGVLTVGIGGSALGAATLTGALGLEGHHVLDNVDPHAVTQTLEAIDFEETVVHAVSRSGTTVETLSNVLVVREAMESAGVDWTERTVVTTGSSGPLARLVDRHDLPATGVPEGVPGRFSALSPVGLLAPAVLGGDVESVLSGAARAADSLAPSLFDCPAYAYGATAAALERRGATVNAMMPYAEALETFTEWFAQLWAESLGKDGLGQTPARAMGATDQHSQLQLYRGGRPTTMVTMLRPIERADRAIPPVASDGIAEELGYLGGRSLGEVLDAEFEATEASLAAAGRPNVRVEIDRVDAEGIGELLYAMEAACTLAAELASIDAFDQPAVEWGKRATREALEGDEADALTGKTTLRVD